MSSYGRNFSTRLFVQAAFTGFLAPLGSHGSTWLVVTFALAGGAAVLGAVVRNGHERTREMVIGFEAVAVAVGAVGLAGHHYIPGTIVGIAALITALNHRMPQTVAVPAQEAPAGSAPVAAYAAPPAAYAPQHAAQAPVHAEPVPAPQFAAPAPATTIAAPAPAAEPVAERAAPVATAYTGVRAMNILPGK